MIKVSCRRNDSWMKHVIEGLRHEGHAVVEGVLDRAFLEETRSAMYDVQNRIQQEVGKERLKTAGEIGVLRLMLKYNPHFLKFLEIPEVLTIINQTVSETAILHLQNGLILPSFPNKEIPSVFQNRFHQDFPRMLNGYLASVNIMFTIDEFTIENGGTLLVPGTHQKIQPPDPDYLKANAISVECAAGSMIVFDSTLWHAAGANVSGNDRLAINHQFTRSYIKQQIDYVRALGDAVVSSKPPRIQQLLGWYTRVVTSLDEYYRPEPERLYRKGQG